MEAKKQAGTNVMHKRGKSVALGVGVNIGLYNLN